MPYQDTIERILKYVIRGGIFFILILPVVMNSNFFFPFIVPKNVLFRIAAEVVFFSWLALMSFDASYRPNFKRIDKLTWAVIAFFVASTVSTIFGLGIYSSFWSNYERMSGLFHLAHLVMFFLTLVGMFRTKQDWHAFFTFSIFTSTLMAFLGLSQFLQIDFLLQSSGGERLSGTLGNPTFLAAYLIFNLFFIAYFLADEKRFDIRTFAMSFLVFDVLMVLAAIFYSAGSTTTDWGFFNFLRLPLLTQGVKEAPLFLPYLVFQIWVFASWAMRDKKYVVTSLLAVTFLFQGFLLYHTQTRGALLGFAAGLGLIAVASLFSGMDKKIKMASAGFLVLLVLSPFMLIGAKDTSFVQNNGTLRRLATISLTDLTTESRLLTWEASWKGWSETPKNFLIGVGPEHYYYAFNKYFPVEIYKDAGSRVWFDRAHNIIFDTGVTTGIVGLAAYLAILGFAAWYLYQVFRKQRGASGSMIMLGLLAAYFIQNIFVFDTMSSEIMLYLTLGFIAFLYLHNNSTEEESEPQPMTPTARYIYLGGLVAVLAIGVFVINVQTLKANSYVFSAAVNYPGNNYNAERFDFYKKSIEESNVGRFEARQQLANHVSAFARSTDSLTPAQREMVDYAIAELEKSVAEEPQNIRHVLWLSSLYNSVARFIPEAPQKGLKLVEDSIPLSPTRPQVYFELGQAYAFSGDNDEAIAQFEKAVALKPDVVDSHVNLLTMLIVTENLERANDQLQMMIDELNWKPRLEDYDRIVDAYARVSNFRDAAQIQEMAVIDYPSAAEYAQLAAIYATFGENEKAIEATQRAIELNPGFASEAEIFIRELEAGNLLDPNEQ